MCVRDMVGYVCIVAGWEKSRPRGMVWNGAIYIYFVREVRDEAVERGPALAGWWRHGGRNGRA